MKRLFLLVALACTTMLHAVSVQKVEPLNWWTNMQCPLTLMVYGDNLADGQVSVLSAKGKAQNGLIIKQVRNAESKNYLFIDLDVRRAGTYTFVIKQGRKKVKFNYEIVERKVSN